MPDGLGSPGPRQAQDLSNETHSHIQRSRTLLLNSSYEPMKVLSWQKALLLWFQDKVEIVEYHNVFARSARRSFQLPSIIRLKKYIRPRQYGVVRFCRENVYLRDKHTCQYCAKQLPQRLLTLDHVVPLSKKGPTSWTNVVTACRSCNQRKGNKTPGAAQMPLLNEPHVPSWLPSAEFENQSTEWPGAWLEYLTLASG